MEFDLDDELVALALECEHDPLLYVETAFPWGEGELKGRSIREWQRRALQSIGDRLKNGSITIQEAILEAIASGHGIGKSALVAWIILWAMSTKEDTRGVVTANTENQLKTKTWAEVAKWHRMCAFKPWFTMTATALFSKEKAHEKTWRMDMTPWSENNTEAFAGLHNEGKRILLIFDEASAIPDLIWEVAEGALTDENTEIIWCVFGNPTRANGRFRECFRKFKHRWTTQQIDSRNVDGTNNEQIKKWAEDFGENSDFFKIRVRGVFPASSNSQYVPTEVIDKAMSGEIPDVKGMPLIMSLDVARGGSDNCVFRFRRGLDGRSIPPIVYPGSEMRDSMRLAAAAVVLLDRYNPDAFFVDETGVGGPIVDRIKQYGYQCTGVNFASKSPDPMYANMRAYMYFKLVEWLRAGGVIEDNDDLRTELEATDYKTDSKDRLLLISKDDIKKLIGVSPDDADALALLHAMPVRLRRKQTGFGSSAADSTVGY